MTPYFSKYIEFLFIKYAVLYTVPPPSQSLTSIELTMN